MAQKQNEVFGPLPDVAVDRFRVRYRAARTQDAVHRVPAPVPAGPYQDLTAIPMPECRNRGPPCLNPGCTSSPRVRYPSSSLPLAASAWSSPHVVAPSQSEDTLLSPNQASRFSRDTSRIYVKPRRVSSVSSVVSVGSEPQLGLLQVQFVT